MRVRRKLTAVGALLAAVLALLLLPAQGAVAHPLGNFTVSTYDGIVLAPGQVRVDHLQDLAEIPATQEQKNIERAGKASWARQRCREAVDSRRLEVDGRGVELALTKSGVEVRPGQAGLDTLRVECRFTAPLPRDRAVNLTYRTGQADTPAWREITARGDRMTLKSPDVRATSPSERLTTYPQRLLDSPPEQTEATVRAVPGGSALADKEQEPPAASVLPRGADRWTQALTDLVARHDLTAGFAALALAIALGLGALHALAPGHGKTLMAATAAAGGHRSLRQVLALGASVTVTHTLGVFALGALVATGSAAGPSVVSWLGVVSGVLVTAAGALLLRRAWRRRATRAHARGHHHGHGHHHDHGHGDSHSHGHTHTHPPTLRLRTTLFLGFAGGLAPSPSAVVVLVGAAALGQVWFGLLLVLAYGMGLALTLSAAGLLVVRVGGSAVERLGKRNRSRRAGRLTAVAHRTAPFTSALVVLALGSGLLLKGAATALG
ncbi:nickel transporter [Streptomyces sp. TRM66268-LWL]|uniref:Nickel transporter n=1 Tax=Streptomyces polyasparticus TaxID=2767826 RepID=A0ABR7SIN1_9ACTN|nr:nickel transporter [Streptomyces polyasparticus]MBC9715366.1 nickel transporter [Streptomyces polyasparticus]